MIQAYLMASKLLWHVSIVQGFIDVCVFVSGLKEFKVVLGSLIMDNH